MPPEARESIHLLREFRELWERQWRLGQLDSGHPRLAFAEGRQRHVQEQRQAMEDAMALQAEVFDALRAVGIDPATIPGGSLEDVLDAIDRAIDLYLDRLF